MEPIKRQPLGQCSAGRIRGPGCQSSKHPQPAHRRARVTGFHTHNGQTQSAVSSIDDTDDTVTTTCRRLAVSSSIINFLYICFGVCVCFFTALSSPVAVAVISSINYLIKVSSNMDLETSTSGKCGIIKAFFDDTLMILDDTANYPRCGGCIPFGWIPIHPHALMPSIDINLRVRPIGARASLISRPAILVLLLRLTPNACNR